MDYDSTWPHTVDALWAPIAATLRSIAVSVVGSAFVPGLAAKPIIDIDVVVPSRVEVPIAVQKLALLGYTHQADLGIEDREAFAPPRGMPAHHLYVCVSNAVALRNPLAMRDFLRRDPGAAALSGHLKKRLAAKFPMDVEAT